MSTSTGQERLDPGLAEQIDRHDRALETRDMRYLESVLTNDFIQVTPNAIPKTRGDWFGWFDNIVKYDQMRRRIINSRSLKDASVVISKCTPVMRVRGGEPSVHRALLLEVWTHRDGWWRKLVEQYTRLPQAPGGHN